MVLCMRNEENTQADFPFGINPERLYTTAEYCDLTRQTISNATDARFRGRSIPFYRVGRRVLYRGSDILAELQAGHVL